jgi:hypothetical protein
MVGVLAASAPERVLSQEAATTAPATQPSLEAQAQKLRIEELDQLVAPIALYPDVLLAQVCMASTYPLEVAIAARWHQQNQNLQGDQLNAALDIQTWDPSVKALIQVPPVLQLMNDKLDWTQKLGDAFLSQQTEVMAAVQRLRKLAVSNGQLQTTAQQTVTTMGQIIVIEQANPEVVYVPAYDPYAYGIWPYPEYPPYYWPGYGLGLAFGLGVIIGGIWDNHWDWGGGNLEVNPLRNTNIDRGDLGNIGRERWQHNVEHRRGVNYRDQATRERFGRGDAAGANARQNFRGFQQGGQLGQGNIANRASFEQGGRLSGFDGLGNGSQIRDQSNRGRSSVQSMNQSSRSSVQTRAGGGGARVGGGFGGGGGGGFRGGGRR